MQLNVSRSVIEVSLQLESKLSDVLDLEIFPIPHETLQLEKMLHGPHVISRKINGNGNLVWQSFLAFSATATPKCSFYAHLKIY